MNMVLVVLVLLLLVGGAVGLIIGRKNINVGTLVGAWLTLLAAVGFIYLAGRAAERERVWRAKVRQTEAELKTTVYGPMAGKRISFPLLPEDTDEAEQAIRRQLVARIEAVGGIITKEISREANYFIVDDVSDKIPDKVKKFELEVLDRATLEKSLNQSLESITASIANKRREQIKLEIWRNRFWRSSFFEPPEIEASSDKPGLYDVSRSAVVKLPLIGGGGNPPINQGAELAIFNLNADDKEGFLGFFSVSKIATADAKVLEVTIDPLTMPDEHDRKAWEHWSLIMRASSKPEVVVFEDLPSAGELAVDVLTKLRGIELESPGGDVVTAKGIEGLRRDILLEMKVVARDTDHISQALAATSRESDRKKATAAALVTDRAAWREDVVFAELALNKLKKRFKRVQNDLQTTRQEIGALRAELMQKTAFFLSEMSRRTPPPGSGEPRLQ